MCLKKICLNCYVKGGKVLTVNMILMSVAMVTVKMALSVSTSLQDRLLANALWELLVGFLCDFTCICMSTCVYAYVYECVFVYLHTCICVRRRMFVHVHVRDSVFVYVHVRDSVFMTVYFVYRLLCLIF